MLENKLVFKQEIERIYGGVNIFEEEDVCRSVPSRITSKTDTGWKCTVSNVYSLSYILAH